MAYFTGNRISVQFPVVRGVVLSTGYSFRVIPESCLGHCAKSAHPIFLLLLTYTHYEQERYGRQGAGSPRLDQGRRGARHREGSRDLSTRDSREGDEVSIAGLGIFVTKARPAREGRNPRTGETIRIAATRTAKFRPAEALRCRKVSTAQARLNRFRYKSPRRLAPRAFAIMQV